MRTTLLDVNVLIALLWPAHEHHEAAHEWFAARGTRSRWATCPLTQLGFVRIVSNPAFSRDALAPADALLLLERNLQHPEHRFWPDDAGIPESVGPMAAHLQGHRQLVDAYLLGLARRRQGSLASFDAGLRSLAGAQPASFELVPTGRAPRSRQQPARDPGAKP